MKLKLLAATFGLMLLAQTAAWAEIGVVDPEKIGTDYRKAKELATQVKSKEDELNTLRNNLAKELKEKGDKMTPVEKKNLEDKLSKQFEGKFIEYRNWFASQDQSLRTAVDSAVNEVSKSQKLDMVLTKQVVLTGGRDVTQDVLNILNK